MTTKEQLISRLNQLSEEDISSLLDAATRMEGKDTQAARPDCPYCSPHALPGVADCIVKDCNDPSVEDTCFYNLNTVNGFHSFIKQRYVFYRGVASKYINKYNVLFSSAYRNAEGIIKRLIGAVLKVTGIDYYHSNRDVREASLLAI